MTADSVVTCQKYLADTRDALLESTAGLTNAQCDFKPSPDRWSIAEIVEHVVIVEQRVHGIVGNLSNAPEPPAGWEQAEVDALVVRDVPNRSQRFQAPERVHPTQHWSIEEALERFRNGRDVTLQLLSSGSSLRGHVFAHPVLGPWDGYQWLMAAGAHGLRHTEQIREVKSSAGFPEGLE
jgi:DinB superfamily